MPTPAESSLTPNEWKIMRIVWELGSCGARDVYALAGERHEMAPTTVKTYLSLLVEKGRLSTRRVGNSFLYKPRSTMLQTLRNAADSLLEKVLGDQHGPLLAHMIRQSKFSAEDITELRRLLSEAEGNLLQAPTKEKKEARKP
jgi:predicted transcriptional regulator